MARSYLLNSRSRALWPLRLLVVFSFLLIGLVAFPQHALAATASDDFNRANGSLGAGWADITDGGLAIAGQAAAGTSATVVSGDIRTGEAYPSDQYSQVQVTSAQLTGGQWIGPMVRAQNGGLNAYVGIYNWNNGSPNLMLFRRSGVNTWTQLGATYNSGPLAAGATLQVSAVGSAISFLLNGVQRISVTDTSLSGGGPGIMSFGTGQVDNWSGGSAGSKTYTVGGTVSGLSGTVVLQDNGGDNLSVGANGPFTFATALASGAAYSVTVLTSPSGQTCTISNGSGTMGSANVTNVAVSCAASGGTTFTVGGTVSGLSGTVVLQDNGGDNLSVGANGPFTFATALTSGAAYSVTMLTSPSGQTCTISGGSGTVGSANVTSVVVTCAVSAPPTGSDDFNRANGSLGAGWADITDGGLAIAGQAAAGTSATVVSGDIRTGEAYPSDQYS